MIAFGPADIPRLDEIRVNGVVVAFTFGIALLTSLIFGLIPALQASRPEVEQALRETARGSTGSTRSRRLRAAFVVSQFAFSLVLLVGAGLLIRSFASLSAVQPGFDPDGVLTFWQALPKARYKGPEEQKQFFDKLLSKLKSLPGIENAGMVSPLPFSGDDTHRTFTIVGQPAPPEGMEPSASRLTTNGSYFKAMRIPLQSGRTFNERDRQDSAPVLMINAAFAEKYFARRKPARTTGQPSGRAAENVPPREIVGVVGTSKHGSLAEPETPEFYIPFTQDPDSYMDIVVRTSEARSERRRRRPFAAPCTKSTPSNLSRRSGRSRA